MKYFFSALFVLALCKPAFAEIGVTDKSVTFGAHTVESGPFAMFGVQSIAAAAYFKKINEKGGVNGRTIEYNRIDTQGDPGKGIQAAKKLVEEDHIFAMFMGMGPSHQAIFKYLVDKKVPDFMIGDQSNVYADKVIDTVFPLSYSANAEAAAIVKNFPAENKGKKVCFISLDLPFGTEWKQGATDALEAANKTMSDKEKYVIGTSEKVAISSPQANTQVAKLKKDGCDIVMTSMYGSLAPNAITYGVSQDFKPKWYLAGQNANSKFLSLVPESVRDGMMTATYLAFTDKFNTPGWQAYADMMKDAGIEVNRQSAGGYANAEFLVEVLKKVGKDLTREKFIKAAEATSGTTCSICLSPRDLSAKNHWTYLNPAVIIAKGMDWVKVK